MAGFMYSGRLTKLTHMQIYNNMEIYTNCSFHCFHELIKYNFIYIIHLGIYLAIDITNSTIFANRF